MFRDACAARYTLDGEIGNATACLAIFDIIVYVWRLEISLRNKDWTREIRSIFLRTEYITIHVLVTTFVRWCHLYCLLWIYIFTSIQGNHITVT